MATILSRNFTLEEMTASRTATAKHIKNTPDTQAVACLAALCTAVLQPLRDAMGYAIPVESGYRCKKLNEAVGGVSNSQHMKGQAADLYIAGDKAKGREWMRWIADNCDFDQLIWEHDKAGTYWVHVSYNPSGNRRQVITNYVKG